MPVFSERDLAFWEENGYVVLADAVPKEHLTALIETVWGFLEMDPDNRDDWYKWKPYTTDDLCSPISDAGMVSLYQHQTLWDNRQYPRVYEAFTEILGTENLWVSLDRANMKPRARRQAGVGAYRNGPLGRGYVASSGTVGRSGSAVPNRHRGESGRLPVRSRFPQQL